MFNSKKNTQFYKEAYSKSFWLLFALIGSGFTLGMMISQYGNRLYDYEQEFLQAKVETVLNEVQFIASQEKTDFTTFDTLLQKTFDKYTIEIDFEYGISKDSMNLAYSSNPENNAQLVKTEYLKSIKSDKILHLQLVNTRKYIFGQLRNTYIFTGIMFLILLASMMIMSENIKKQFQLAEQKNNFINNITHELKTPIATIDFALANIENEKNITQPDKIRQITRVIRDENKRMNMQVERVLRVAKADKKALQLDVESVDIHEIIEVLCDGAALKIQQLNGVLHQDLVAKNAIIKGDAFHLTNVLSNLLDNAIKYSKEKIDISISTENNHKGLIIKVEDKGIGIDLKNQKYVFERFFRVDTGDIHNIKGFGLGLSYVKSIVEQHRGKVSLKSKKGKGKGSTFTVFLPFEKK